ncbi:MAG: GldM family protein [Saprospiraceae bacterium]
MKKHFIFIFLLFTSCKPVYQVVVAAQKQNRLYLHVENPIDIGITGMRSLSYSVTSDNGSVFIKNSQYYILPKTKGKCHVFIKKGNKIIGESIFHVSGLPKPVVRLFTLKHRGVEKNLEDYRRIYVDFEDFIFDVRTEVVSFTVELIRNDVVLNEVFNKNSSINEDTKALMKNRKEGDIILFRDVKAVLEDGGIITAKDLRLEIYKDR